MTLGKIRRLENLNNYGQSASSNIIIIEVTVYGFQFRYNDFHFEIMNRGNLEAMELSLPKI